MLILLSLPAGLAVLLILVYRSDIRSTERAAAFCSRVEVGISADEVATAALDAGAHLPRGGWFSRDESAEVLMVIFTGMNKFSGSICRITAVNGRVVSIELSRLDL